MAKLEAKWTDRGTLGGTLYSNIDCKWDIKILNACKKKQYFRGNSNTHLILDKLCTKIYSKWIVLVLTDLLTPWSRVLLEKLTGFAANQEIPRILWNPHFYHPHNIGRGVQIIKLLIM